MSYLPNGRVNITDNISIGIEWRKWIVRFGAESKQNFTGKDVNTKWIDRSECHVQSDIEFPISKRLETFNCPRPLTFHQ